MSKIKVNDKSVLELATEIAENMYDIASDFPPDEDWRTAGKLRNAASDLLFYVAQGVGDIDSSTSQHEWRFAHKQVSALKITYKFSAKQGFTEINPDIMVKLDDLSENIQKEFKRSEKQKDAEAEKDLKPWLKKYELWKEMQNES